MNHIQPERICDYVTLMFSLSDTELFDLLDNTRSRVLKQRPHAVFAFVVDRKGTRTHCAIFDAPVELNQKHQFAKDQHAPQLLSPQFDWQDDRSERAKTHRTFEAWLLALVRLTK